MAGPYDAAHAGSAAGAAGADAGDLEGVPLDAVAVRAPDGGHPSLEGRCSDLDGRAAHPADDVVVVRVAVAAAVRRLAGGRASYVDVAVVGQGLQRAVDARQPDGGAARPQLGVDVLRR